MGREADTPGEDGRLARTTHLDAEPGTATADAAIAALQQQQVTLEEQLEDLRNRRTEMSAAEYQERLEKLLVHLARVAQQIRLKQSAP
jgi:hypothetical protein